MKKLFFLLTIVSFLIVSCEKDEDVLGSKTQTKTEGFKAYSSSIYNSEYIPEDYENQLQLFFDDIDNYSNEEDIEIEQYSISDGIWNFISSLNYTKSYPFSKIIDVKEYEYEVSLSFFNQEEDYLTSQSLIEEFIDMHETLDSLNTENSKLLLLGFNAVELSDSSITLYLKATKAIIEDFDEVDLATCPNGVPSGAELKMGLPNNGYESAAMEYQIRYNPYLWQSRMANIQHAYNRYLLQYTNSWFFSWTNSSNCFYDWPDGDYIPYVNCSYAKNADDADINGSRFNLYLSRFWDKKVDDIISYNNQNNDVYLYFSNSVSHINVDPLSGYITPYNVSAIKFVYKKAEIIDFTKSLDTYTY